MILLLTISIWHTAAHVCGALIQNHYHPVQVPIQFHYVLGRQEKVDWLVETMPPYTSYLVSYAIVLYYLCIGTTTTNSKSCPWNIINVQHFTKIFQALPLRLFSTHEIRFTKRGRARFKRHQVSNCRRESREWRAQRSPTEWWKKVGEHRWHKVSNHGNLNREWREHRKHRVSNYTEWRIENTECSPTAEQTMESGEHRRQMWYP